MNNKIYYEKEQILTAYFMMQTVDVQASWLLYKYCFYTKSKLDLSSIENISKSMLDLDSLKQFDQEAEKLIVKKYED